MFSLDLKGGLPIYEQLYDRIAELILNGTLSENEKLPTVREVAKELGVNPNTVQKTYQMLERDNLIYSVPAKGSYAAALSEAMKIMQEKSFREFDKATENALRRGILRKQLHDRVDSINVYKEEENDTTAKCH